MECKSINEAFKWEGEDGHQYTRRMIADMVRSPEKWKTEQRDNYRQFAESPSKKDDELAEGLKNFADSEDDDELKT